MIAAVFDASKGDPFEGFLIACGIVLVLLVLWAIDRARAGRVSCSCDGGRVRSWLRSDAWGPHKACEGKGSRRRVL